MTVLSMYHENNELVYFQKYPINKNVHLNINDDI